MTQFILRKNLNIKSFEKYISPAQKTNQFANYGSAVRLLESRARKMLQIDDSKAVIATSSGSSAHHAAFNAIFKKNKYKHKVGSQAFTFPTAGQGPSTACLVVDFNSALNVDIEEVNSRPIEGLCVTNSFGHIQDLEYISDYLKKDVYLVFDNAATPFSFYNGINSCNYGTAAFISLHHTKPIGFGEGGLLIIDNEFEEMARESINFSFNEQKDFNEWGGNYKMSEISAASILQWWDQFEIEDLREKYLIEYYKLKYELKDESAQTFPHYGDEEFFPSCLPLIYNKNINLSDINSKHDTAKYYKPIADKPISQSVYDKIICYGIAPKEI